jgi:hypothetical protein
MPLVFRVSTRKSGARRFVRVSVYDNPEELRRAADRYTKRVGVYAAGEFKEAHGVTHSFERLLVTSEGELESPENSTAAHIRLHKDALATVVVTHEVAHAALAIYNQDVLRRDGPVHQDMENEEIICYLIGDLSARVVDRLYRYGLYEE